MYVLEITIYKDDIYYDHIQFNIIYNIVVGIAFIELIIWLFEQFNKMFP